MSLSILNPAHIPVEHFLVRCLDPKRVLFFFEMLAGGFFCLGFWRGLDGCSPKHENCWKGFAKGRGDPHYVGATQTGIGRSLAGGPVISVQMSQSLSGSGSTRRSIRSCALLSFCKSPLNVIPSGMIFLEG